MWRTGVVGASGAVFGLFGAFARAAAPARPVVGRHVRDHRHQRRDRVRRSPGIAWQAHLGGLLTGAAVAAAIAYSGRNRGPLAPPPDQRVHWFSMGGILLVLVVLTIGKYALG